MDYPYFEIYTMTKPLCTRKFGPSLYLYYFSITVLGLGTTLLSNVSNYNILYTKFPSFLFPADTSSIPTHYNSFEFDQAFVRKLLVTNLVLVVITRERVIVTSNAPEVIEARNEVVDIGCSLGTAASVGEERAASVQSIVK